MTYVPSPCPQEADTGVGVAAGAPFPLGSTITETGVNFSIFSSHATEVSLLLFESAGSPFASRTYTLDPIANRTSHYWHIHIAGIGHGQVYAYRMCGSRDSEAGHRFDSEKVLLDPYGKAVCSLRYRRQSAVESGNNEQTSLRSAVIDLNQYDWEDDVPLQTPFHKTVIYELHVGGFTRNPNSGLSAARRGTYAGVVEKIPYLKDLGSQRSNFCLCFSLIGRMRRKDLKIIGATVLSVFLRPTSRTVQIHPL